LLHEGNHTGDTVLVASQETLGAGEDVAYDYCRSEGVDNVLIVWVEEKTIIDVP
jgi:hypothetical protein